jgi:hypothetical protein
MLLDGEGNDTYDALYYAQGVGVHQGAALFADRGGDDAYDLEFPNQGASLAMANDLSVAVFFDSGGNDQFRGGDLTMGTGLANGIAVFATDSGDDVFHSPSTYGFGNALTGDVTGARKSAPTFGVFVKAGGKDTYTVGDKEDDRDGHTWKHDDGESGGKGPAQSVGVDAPTGRVHL